MTETAQDSVKAALRHVVGPYLRAEGFRGSGKTWRLHAPNGDVAVVNVQSSSWSSREELRCVINLAVVPLPWWEWSKAWARGAVPVQPVESWGLFRTRLHPSATGPVGDNWWLVCDAADAQAVASDMVQQLRANGVPTLRRLLERDAMLVAVRAGELGEIRGEQYRRYFYRALAVLLTGAGPSEELEALLGRMEAEATSDELFRPSTPAFVAWVRQNVLADGP